MIHSNTAKSYKKCLESGNFDQLILRVLNYFHVCEPESFTDREIKELLWKSGTPMMNDMNAVRPKITKLIAEGFLEEVGKVHDKETDRMVRKVRFLTACPDPPPAKKEQQADLFQRR